MSKKHPVVAVTGSSGAGTTTVKRAFEHIFIREGINAAVVEGDSFHRYERGEMKIKMTEEHLSHFGPEANRILEEIGLEVAASAGAACHSDTVQISEVLTAMKVPLAWAKGTLRLTTGRMTTAAEIDQAIQVVAEATRPSNC